MFCLLDPEQAEKLGFDCLMAPNNLIGDEEECFPLWAIKNDILSPVSVRYYEPEDDAEVIYADADFLTDWEKDQFQGWLERNESEIKLYWNRLRDCLSQFECLV